MKKYGNLTKYLDVLIKRYRFLLYTDYFEPSENPKTQYQKRGEVYIIHKSFSILKSQPCVVVTTNCVQNSLAKIFI